MDELSDFELSVDVDFMFKAEAVEEASAPPDVVTEAIAEPEVLPEVFTFDPAPVEEGPHQLTAWEQRVVDSVMSGDFNPFSDIYANADGSINMELWWTASTIANNLEFNGVEQQDYQSTILEWLASFG